MPKKTVPAKKVAPKKKATPKKNGPVKIGTVEITPGELCIRHLRWTPCLGHHARYDSSVRECHITDSGMAGALLQQHHEGKMSKEELAEAFSNITNYTVQMTAETVES